MDNRIVWGGYDAVYHFGRKVDSAYEDRADTYRRLAAHFFITFPQLEDVRFTHRWAGAIDTNTRFCAHWGLAREGRVAYVNGFTGLGVGAARFAADVCLDLLDGVERRAPAGDGAAKPLPFPPEPLASIGIQATGGRWTAPTTPRAAQHPAAHPRRVGPGFRLLTPASAPRGNVMSLPSDEFRRTDETSHLSSANDSTCSDQNDARTLPSSVGSDSGSSRSRERGQTWETHSRRAEARRAGR